MQILVKEKQIYIKIKFQMHSSSSFSYISYIENVRFIIFNIETTHLRFFLKKNKSGSGRFKIVEGKSDPNKQLQKERWKMNEKERRGCNGSQNEIFFSSNTKLQKKKYYSWNLNLIKYTIVYPLGAWSPRRQRCNSSSPHVSCCT